MFLEGNMAQIRELVCTVLARFGFMRKDGPRTWYEDGRAPIFRIFGLG